MGEGPARAISWPAKVRRLFAAPFRFLLQEELASLKSQVFALNQELTEVRLAYLATRSEFEEVRDRRVPQLEKDFSRFQKGFSQLQAELERLRDVLVPQVETRWQGAFENLQRELERLRDVLVPQVEQAQGQLQRAFEGLQGELVALRDHRLAQLERAQEGVQAGHKALQEELEHLRDRLVPSLGQQIAGISQALAAVQALAEEVRDQRLPAAVARLDALIERLAEELQVVRGLLDRVLLQEPLQVPPLEEGLELALPEAVRQASLRFLQAHRGDSQEILERVGVYLELFREAAPVLDLGCGRGELLRLLTQAGIQAWGVDADPSAVAFCRQLGLEAHQQDALAALEEQEAESLGGIAAVHLVEHLPAALWMRLFAEAARVLRPGGVFAVESPNPETLRVGGGGFWLDPTHQRPVHPEAARFVAEAVGLEVVEIRFLHPFPQEQMLATKVPDPTWKPLLETLDLWLSGPRDYLLVARKPAKG
jgi:O-antigen chain-terminating methyltransferase